MIVVLLFIMAKALAPNYGAALAFRFICAVFAASPMTVAGGTIGDIWTPMQLPFGLPLVTFAAYAGPILGPVIGAYTPEVGFAWADWISLIVVGVALIFVLLAQPETYSPVLLEWRAKHLRELTGDNRYQTTHASASSLGTRLLTNVARPFTMIWTEPIILVFSFYLILLYFVLFTFLNGYPFIFTRVYGITTSMTFIIFTAMMPGIFVAMALIPFIYSLTKKAAAKAAAAGKPLQPEVSLYWAMAGASILMPVSLFWMAWTCYVREPSLSSPVFCALTSFFVERHQHLVAHCGLGRLRLRPSLHLHHVLHVHHLRIPAVRGIRSWLHDLFTIHSFRRAKPSLGQNVREHRPALVADNRGHCRYYYGACAVHPVQIWPQGAGYEQTCPEQGLERMVWFPGPALHWGSKEGLAIEFSLRSLDTNIASPVIVETVILKDSCLQADVIVIEEIELHSCRML